MATSNILAIENLIGNSQRGKGVLAVVGLGTPLDKNNLEQSLNLAVNELAQVLKTPINRLRVRYCPI
ncbi:hypothetical protein RH824_003185 [Vibrio parahaemolyticus]|nr:hypothetical protein [Vibrio parahaemolyticus]EGQ9210244.1 hypothetical protein [Vibrio parahaemolyticus]EGQ9787215.1 hypothetical protein [Vibrio parahaemolyticus]EGQ9924279.1 hypothetical protein [Vibrio parahaemolyticus]EGR0674316.1 hypothetical protein [Vibrio parahaemolyticus]